MIRENIDLSFPSPPPASLGKRLGRSISFHAGFSPPSLCVPYPFPGHLGADIWSLGLQPGKGLGRRGETHARDEEDANRLLSMSIDN